jgi:hemolysin activation/secretion protein
LPDDADVTARGGGVELGISRVDNRLNPRKGFEGKLGATVLLREVRKSDEVLSLNDASGFDYSKLYDSLTGRSNQLFLTGYLGYYLPLAKKVVLKTAYNGAYIQGKNLFRNELYQIGGFRLLRGFDEQSIYASQYHVLSLELRLLLDQRSYFYLFSDNGYVQTHFAGLRKNDFYNGLGIGTTIETKTGLFSISYAVGRNESNPIQLRQSKIHFGYAAYF